jgi:hypothetical protein
VDKLEGFGCFLDWDSDNFSLILGENANVVEGVVVGVALDQRFCGGMV